MSLDPNREPEVRGSVSAQFCTKLFSTPVRQVAPQIHEIIFAEKLDSVGDVLCMLTKERINAIPILDEKTGQFICFVGIFDILVYLIDVGAFNDPYRPEEDSQALLNEHLQRSCESLFMRTKRLNWFALPQEAPVQVAIDLFSKFETHRMALYDSKGQLSSVLTLSQVIRWISQNDQLKEIGALTENTMNDLQLGQRAPILVGSKDNVFHAFKKIVDTGASGIGVVGPDGHLAGHVSASDLKDGVLGMGPNFTVRKFLLQIDEYLMAKVSGQSVPRLVYCTNLSTVQHVIAQFRRHKTHRLHLVQSDDALKPIGVVTLCDILSLFTVTFPVKPTRLTA